MNLLTFKPRADYSLRPHMRGGRSTFDTTGAWRWGEPKGSPIGELITPSTLNPGRNFDPINMLLFARRGQGKTLTVTGLLKIFDGAFHNPDLGRFRGVRRAISNYYVKFLMARGPLGYDQPSYYEVPDGEGGSQMIYGQMALDPCDQHLPDRMTAMPAWGRHKLMAIDEMADVLNAKLAMSRNVRDWGSVLMQQRKMFTEYLGATQRPQAVARNDVMFQIDLLGLVKPHKLTWSADILVFDIHGQFTGNWHKHKWLPPLEQDADWSFGIEHLDRVKDQYNTFEVIAPTWFKNREGIITRQYRDLESFGGAENMLMVDEPDTESDFDSEERVLSLAHEPAYRSEAQDALAALKMPITLELAKKTTRASLEAQVVRSPAAFEEWLKAHGFSVYQDRKTGETMVKEKR